MNSDWAIVGLTVVLVATTIWYTVQNGRMVAEMRASRRQSVAPRLIIDLDLFGQYVFVLVRNVGQGSALAGQLEVVFVATDDGALIRKAWETHALAPGAERLFAPRNPGETEPMTREALLERAKAIVLRGHVHDSLGDCHVVDERMDDFSERVRMAIEMESLARKSDLIRIRDELSNLTGEVRRLRRFQADGLRDDLGPMPGPRALAETQADDSGSG